MAGEAGERVPDAGRALVATRFGDGIFAKRIL